MPIYNGWEKSKPREEILRNELDSYRTMVSDYPGNDYYKARLAQVLLVLSSFEKGGANNPTRKVTHG